MPCDTNSPAYVAQQGMANSLKDFISQSSLVVGVANEWAFPKRSYVYRFVHVVSVVPSESRRGLLDLLQLELQAAMSLLTWLLGPL